MSKASEKPEGRRSRAGRPAAGEGEKLTQHVLRVGMAMFLDRGFAATTIDAIVLKARISKATFYARFPSKTALLEAGIADLAARRAPVQMGEAVMSLAFGARVERFSDYLLDQIVDPETIKLERLATAESYRFPQVARMVQDMGAVRAQEVIRWFFDDAVARGDLRPMDTAVFARMYLDLLFGFLRRTVHGLARLDDREAIWGGMHATNALLFGPLRADAADR